MRTWSCIRLFSLHDRHEVFYFSICRIKWELKVPLGVVKMSTDKRAEADAIQTETADSGLDHLKNVDLHDKALANQALEGTIQEHNVGIWQAFKTHRRAALWSIRKHGSTVRLRPFN